jgi:hypothetical protein
MSATRRFASLALAAATGLLMIAMTSESFAIGPPIGPKRPPPPTCTGSCQTNKAGNPGTVLTNGRASPGGVGNASGGKGLRQR